jgi:hypothetical protein
MENLSTKEFIDQLNSNTLKSTFGIKGIVKKSGKDSEVLFTHKGDMGNWHIIPASMIDSVTVIKTFVKEGETYAVAKLRLKTPTSPETKVIYDLFESIMKEDKGIRGGLLEHLYNFAHNHFHRAGCQCSGHGDHKECTCGCHKHGCNCSCHKH